MKTPLKIKISKTQIARSMFAEQFTQNMKGGTIEGFRKKYPTLHDKVIIPLIEYYISEYEERNNKLIKLQGVLEDLNGMLEQGDAIKPDSLMHKAIKHALNK